jgi:hypothetical protein
MPRQTRPSLGQPAAAGHIQANTTRIVIAQM